jgi:multidrug efflux pump subunit AcrB
VSGPNRNNAQDYAIAKDIETKMKQVRGAVDVHVNQVTDEPELRLNVDRMRAAQLGLTQQQIASNILVSLSSSSLTAPSFWIDPKTGVQYSVTAQTPQYKISSIDDLMNSPISSSIESNNGGQVTPLLSSVATLSRDTAPEVISHYNIEPVYDVYANNQDRDLGGVAHDVERIVAAETKQLPRGSFITVLGQVQTMDQSFTALGAGLLGAIILVYLLLVVNFESWMNPFVILTATPGALAGIIWMLFVTHTTFCVPSLMGGVMCVGVATANSILLVTFANQQRQRGKDAIEAALEAGYTRLRPIVMTALAMIVGMIPMALGLGEGGEQNAPLGRAVIGGLLFATFNTLFFVPVIYSLLCRKQSTLPQADDEDTDEFSSAYDDPRGTILIPD